MTPTATPGSADLPLEPLTTLLRRWLPGRRWFPAKGVDAQLEVVATVLLDDERVRILLVRVRAGTVDTLLQVPLVLDPAHAGDAADGPSATLSPSSPLLPAADDADTLGRLGDAVLRDAVGDPAFLRAWLAAADGPNGRAPTDLDPATARVITGEQSNTSVVLRRAGADPREPAVAILKVFRALAAGPNPDVDVPRRLVEVGWDGVPAPLGWLRGRWPDATGALVEGYLGALSAFVPAARDGFELACELAGAGIPFDDEAGQLGGVIAGMHAALLRGFGAEQAPADADGPADSSGAAQVARQLEERFAWAAASVPDLHAYADRVHRTAARVRELPTTPPRQRVHGDLHLGQVLRSAGRWVVTDFEGEPLVPLATRTRPDLAVRDVAGMLRSFDYAAAVGGLHHEAARDWAGVARTALLRRYDEVAGTTLATGEGSSALLLTALELDKALYEAVYEQRNRPDWLHIPLAGVDRLLP